MPNSYFDFHFHPVFKQFITKFESIYPTARLEEELCKEMDLENDILDVIDEVALHILESQCAWNQVQKGGVRLGVANVVAMEYGIAASEGFLAKILRSNLTRPMDKAIMHSVSRGDISYYHLFLKELDLYRKLNGGKLNFLTRKKQRNLDENGYYMVLGMEGGHNLCRKKIGKNELDKPYQGVPQGAHYEDFRTTTDADQVKSMKQLHQALWDENLDLFYITLTHLTFITEQPLATHAFGMKMLDHPAFYPKGNGLTELGKKIIDAAYTMQAKYSEGDGFANELRNTPVYIDIKHMGAKSRRDFFAYRKEKNYNVPIIASHMGVTGYRYDEWIGNLKTASLFRKADVQAIEIMTGRKKAGEWGFINKKFTFNPWSINLMDEDIEEILESEGMIGVSLDVRILGFQAEIGMSSKDQSEYLSVEDFRTFYPHVKVDGLATEALEDKEVIESWLVPSKEERHPLCLCFNILHIVSVGLIHTSVNPWKHICIGSDFDGLIDPVKICRDASKMPELEKDLIRWMPVAEESYRKQNGGPDLLERTANGQIDLGKLKTVVRQIMYENGKDFIQKWLQVSSWKKTPAGIEIGATASVEQ